MATVESLQAKRASLVGNVEQLVGQINRVNGAIALLDDLIAEETAAASASAVEPPTAPDDAPPLVPDALGAARAE